MRMISVSVLCSELFYKLGFCIGKNPKAFIILPVIVAVILATGILQVRYENSSEYLYSLTNGEARTERKTLNEYFPLNSTNKFTPSRLIYPGRNAQFIITRKDEGSIIDSDTWSEIMEVDSILRHVSIDWEGQSYNYSQLCAAWNGVCYQNEHLGLGTLIDKINNGSFRFGYPIVFNPKTYQTYHINQYFGGITLVNNETSTVKSIQAVNLNYFARHDTLEDNAKGLKWEQAVVDRFAELKNHWKTIRVSYSTFVSLNSKEPDKNFIFMLPYFSISICFMLIFVAATSFTGNWVTSKPWPGLLGIFSAMLGAASSVGLLCYLNIEFIGINTAIPFIALGVGVDDTFVVLASWWRTSPKHSVPQRMANCYSDAAVSITITTLTDMLSFYVGILSTTPSVKIFCIHAGTALFFIYLFHIFFFGGILALSGYFEQEKRHSFLIWRKIKTEEKSGGIDIANNNSSEDEHFKGNRAVTEFFKEKFATMLQTKSSKIFVMLSYAAYLGISVWGFLQMKEGLMVVNIVHRSSHLYEYYNNFDHFFRHYPYRYQMIMTGEFDYSLKENQEKIHGVIQEVVNSPYVTEESMENWLTSFLRFVDNYQEFYDDFNVTTEQGFIDTLRTHFLTNTSVYTEDVKFNENKTKIIATRYILQSHDIFDAKQENEVIILARKLKNRIDGLEIVTFHPYSVFIDLNVSIKQMTMMLVGVAAIIVMIVCVIFIPSLSGSLLVLFSIASTEFGTVASLSTLDVRLDTVSILQLIMCIGFSVDFVAHISYTFFSSKSKKAEDKVKDALHVLGLPIMQGSLSTIIAVLGLIFVNSYVAQSFIRIVTVVMILSVYHALFILPTLLLIFKPGSSEGIFNIKSKTYVVNT